MEKGFFVVVKQSRPLAASAARWKSDLIDPIRGWLAVTGSTLEEALQGQQSQYAARLSAKEEVPELVLVKDSPMASGQMIRFVPIPVPAMK